MYLIAIAWMYVVLMMAVVEALAPHGTLMGAFVTLLLYGVLPLGVLMYILGAPGRGKLRKAAEAADRASASASAAAAAETAAASSAPDGSGHAAGEAIAAERKEA